MGITALAVLASTPALTPAPAVAADQPQRLGDYLAGWHAQYVLEAGRAIEFYRSALKSDPDNLDIRARIFSILVSEGRLEEAIPLAKTLLDAGAEQANLATVVLALQDVKAKKFSAVLDQLESLPDDGVNAFSVPLLKAWVLAGQKNYTDALAVLKDRMSNPGVIALFGPHAALISELSGDTEAGEKHLESALKRFRRVGLNLTRIAGRFYERIGKPEIARKMYHSFLRLQPGSPLFDQAIKRLNAKPPKKPAKLGVTEGMAEALYSLSRSFQRQNPFEASIFIRLAIYVNSNFSIAKLRLGDALLRNDRIEDGIKVYETIAKDPDYGWAARLRIARSHNFLDRTDKAAEILEAMAAERKERIDALVTLGDIFRRRMKYRDAADAFITAKKRVKTFEERHWQLLYWNAATHERLKIWPPAEKDFLKALELRPNEPTVLNYLGYSWVEQGKNLDKARTMIETAVRKMPQAGFIVDSLGWVQYRLGDMKGAVKNLERAVLLTPGDPTINDHLGDAYWRVGREREARFQWEKALSLEPEEDQIPIIKKKLKEGLPES